MHTTLNFFYIHCSFDNWPWIFISLYSMFLLVDVAVRLEMGFVTEADFAAEFVIHVYLCVYTIGKCTALEMVNLLKFSY